jgi:hypothetical protein
VAKWAVKSHFAKQPANRNEFPRGGAQCYVFRFHSTESYFCLELTTPMNGAPMIQNHKASPRHNTIPQMRILFVPSPGKISIDIHVQIPSGGRTVDKAPSLSSIEVPTDPLNSLLMKVGGGCREMSTIVHCHADVRPSHLSKIIKLTQNRPIIPLLTTGMSTMIRVQNQDCRGILLVAILEVQVGEDRVNEVGLGKMGGSSCVSLNIDTKKILNRPLGSDLVFGLERGENMINHLLLRREYQAVVNIKSY